MRNGKANVEVHGVKDFELRVLRAFEIVQLFNPGLDSGKCRS